MKPGDVAFSHNDRHWYGWVISVFTKSRYSHCKLVIAENGRTVEATNGGVRFGMVQPEDVVSSPPLTDEQRLKCILFAKSLIGTPYGWVDIVVIGLAQVGVRLPSLSRELSRVDRLFCSQLVDYVWRRAGFRAFMDQRQPQNVSPGDLADLALRGGWPSTNALTDRKTSKGRAARSGV